MTSKYEELEQQIQDLEKELVDQKNNNDYDRLARKYMEDILNKANFPIFLKNTEYKYIFMNRPLGLLAHVPCEQVQGKDDFAVFSKSIAQLFRSQDEEVVKRRSLIEFEETILLPAGMHTFMTAKFPLFDSEGEVYAVGGICTDITTRKKAEAELKEAEEKYRGIFEHAPLGILHINKEGIITASNEKLAEILGTIVERIIGVDLRKYKKDEKIRAAIISVLSGKIVHYDGHYLSVTGAERVYLRGVFSPICSSDGSIVGAIGIVNDITRQKKAEEALQNAHDELEHRVVDRTTQLDRKTKKLQETNVAFRILLETREEDKKELEKKVMFNIEKLIYPLLEKLKLRCNHDSQKPLLKIIQSNLDEITSSFAPDHINYLASLTPAQIQIANLIKQGQTTKEIASLLNLSPATIACQRQEIRKRLSLTNKKTNLQTALTTSS